MNGKPKISTKFIVTVSSLTSIALVIFMAVTANYYITRMSENNNELYKAYQTAELTKAFRSNVGAIDGALKRYMLTGDARFIEQLQVKETELKTQLNALEKYFEGREQSATFEKLRELTYKKLAQAKELKQNMNLAGMQGADNNEESARTLDEINQAIEELNNGLSQTSQVLLNNSVHYLSVSGRWNLLQIAVAVIVALAGILILFRDVNLRNQLEAELRNAKKQAEENANMKEQFMANVSHEIRTPMNAILGYSELLKKTQLSTPQADYLKAISNSGNNLLNIINDILDFSKIEAGKLKIEKIAFDLREQLEAIRLMFGGRAAEKKIELVIESGMNVPPHIFGDPTRLNQVLVNLVGNAIKFTESGGVYLSCELKSLEHEVACLVFRVKDTGVGIPADKLEGIFERFNQGNKETTRRFGGTGLGLAIVKSLVELQNGDIYVKSKDGLGSEFVVTLSFPVSYEQGVAPTIPKSSLNRFDGLRYSILLVEDNPLNQKLACAFIENFGLAVTVADNGRMAVDALRQHTYHLVLMDIQMPVMDGYTATRIIREELKLQIPIVAMTANVTEGEKEKCLSAGMNDYLPKPFREGELNRMLAAYLPAAPAEKNSSAANNLLDAMVGKTTVLDIAELKDLSRGNSKFICEMIEIFLEQNPADVAKLELAVAQGNFQETRALAHRMKTSVGFMALKPLIAPLNTMELLAENHKDLAQIKENFTKIKRDCEISVKELNDVYNHLKQHTS